MTPADRIGMKNNLLESVTGLPECPHLLMETLHDLEMIDAEQYISVLIAYAVAMKAENAAADERTRTAWEIMSNQKVALKKAEAALAEKTSLLDSLPDGDLRKLGALLADMLDSDRWNNIEPYLEAVKVQLAIATQNERKRIIEICRDNDCYRAIKLIEALADEEQNDTDLA